MTFSSKVVVVTGGAQGIGAAAALDFLAKNARVAVLDLDCQPLEQRLCDSPSMAARCLTVSGDCTDPSVISGFFDQVEATWGGIDILFNNVGQSARERSGPFAESLESTWRFVLEVSLLTSMRACRRVVAGMCERKFGRIINMSSDAAFVGDAGLTDYATAKMGIVGLTRSLAREVAAKGVTVNAICPGAIRTRAHALLNLEILERIVLQTPAGFIGEPEDVAAAVSFLASDGARFITGQTLLIDGGRWMI